MKLLKNKTVVGILAILLGIVVCFILSPLYSKALEKKERIVMATHYIAKGNKISKDDVKEIEVGSYHLPETVLKEKEKVIGSYARTDIYAEDYLLSAKLSKTPLSNDEYLNDLDGIIGAISVTLQTFASGLSGKLQNGDIISIIATDEKDGTSEIPPQLQYVKVLASTSAEGTDIKENTANQKEDEDQDSLPATVTLLVNDTQAKQLAYLENFQRLHFKLVYRGDQDICDQFLEKQQKYFEESDTATDKIE